MEEKAYVERARKAYKAYKILYEKGLLEDAFSRGYYTILHLGYALFLKNNETIPKTHTGLLTKLWAMRKNFKIDDSSLKQLSRFQALRESGDYSPLPSITKKDLDDLNLLIKKFFNILGEKP